MPQVSFTVCTNQVLLPTGVTGTGATTIYTSPTIQNQFGLLALRMILEYADLLPAMSSSFGLTAIVESPNGAGLWYPIAYQFSPMRNEDEGTNRLILLAPHISTFDSGIDDGIWVGDKTVSKISRQQGKVGLNGFRTRIVLQDSGYGQAHAFQSAKVTIYGDLGDE